MKKILFILSAVLFGLLLGTGLQWFIMMAFTFEVKDITNFTTWNWIFQVAYWLFLISFSAFLATEATEDEGF